MTKLALSIVLMSMALFSCLGLKPAQDSQVLAELDSTAFGSTILSTLAIQLATKGPLDEVAVALNQVRKLLQQQQDQDNELNRTNQAQCETTIATFQGQIKLHTQQKAENSKILEQNRAAFDQAKKDLSETVQALQTNAKRLGEGQTQRDQQHSDFAVSLHEHEQGIKAIDAALQLLGHLKAGSASFLQMKHRVTDVQKQLIEAQKNSTKGHLYTPLIEALSQMAERATPDLLDKITKLFNDLRQTFVKDKQGLTNIETQQAEAWTSLKSDLQTERETLQTKRNDLERQIEGLKKIFVDAEKNIKFHDGEMLQAQNNLKAKQSMCGRFSANYLRRTDIRKRERTIIHRIIKYFEKKIKVVSEFVKDRVEGSKL